MSQTENQTSKDFVLSIYPKAFCRITKRMKPLCFEIMATKIYETESGEKAGLLVWLGTDFQSENGAWESAKFKILKDMERAFDD